MGLQERADCTVEDLATRGQAEVISEISDLTVIIKLRCPGSASCPALGISDTFESSFPSASQPAQIHDQVSFSAMYIRLQRHFSLCDAQAGRERTRAYVQGLLHLKER